MQFDNLSSDILKILSPQNLNVSQDAIKLEAFARLFSEGQTLTGQVTQVLSQGRALVNFEGTQVLVELGRTVSPRETLTVRVDSTQPTPVLKLLDASSPSVSSTSNTINTNSLQPARQEGVVTHLSSTGIQREQAFSLRALQHGIQRTHDGSSASPIHGRENLAGKFSEISGGRAPGQTENPAAAKSNTPSGATHKTASSVEVSASAPGESRNTQGDVSKLSRPPESRVSPDQFVPKSILNHLKLEAGSTVRLEVLRGIDSQTLLASTPEGPVAVKIETASIFKPGDPVIATLQSHDGKPFLEGVPKNQIIQPVTTGMIKPVFPQRQPIGTIAAELEQKVLTTPAFKDIPLDAKLVERIQQTIQVLRSPAPESLSESRVQEWVNRSGVNYEPQVRNLLLEGEHPQTRIRLEQDLKGQVLELVGKLDDHVKKMALPEPILRQVSEMVQNIQRTIQGIEYHQLNQQFSRQENLPILLQVPSHALGNEENLQIYVRRDFEDSGGSDTGPKESYQLVFLLELSSLGSLRIDTQVREEGLSIQIKSEDPRVIDFINSRSEDLQSSLQEMGFTAEVLGRVQEKIEMEMPDPIEERMVYDPTRLVDIET